VKLNDFICYLYHIIITKHQLTVLTLLTFSGGHCQWQCTPLHCKTTIIRGNIHSTHDDGPHWHQFWSQVSTKITSWCLSQQN